jgi:hypothetical protein
MTSRTLVVEKREDGSQRVLSLPIVQWEIYDQPPPQPSPKELRDEVNLLLRDLGFGEEPLISFDDAGELRLTWQWEIEQVAQALVVALAPGIRRARRVRRSAPARTSKPQNLAVERPPKLKRHVIELQQGRDGCWLRTEVGGERLVVAASVLDSVRRHADDVHRDRPGHEAYGALVVGDDGRVVRYTRLSNPSRKPGHVSIRAPWQLERRPDGHRLIPCHSHPPGTRTTPSPRDIETAHRLGWSAFAIWSSHGLRFWRPDDGDGVVEVAFEIVR